MAVNPQWPASAPQHHVVTVQSGFKRGCAIGALGGFLAGIALSVAVTVSLKMDAEKKQKDGKKGLTWPELPR